MEEVVVVVVLVGLGGFLPFKKCSSDFLLCLGGCRRRQAPRKPLAGKFPCGGTSDSGSGFCYPHGVRTISLIQLIQPHTGLRILLAME